MSGPDALGTTPQSVLVTGEHWTGSPNKSLDQTLTLQSLLFSSISLLFWFSLLFLAFSCVFPLFSKDFRGSAKRKTLAFLGENPCFFQKSKDWRVREIGKKIVRKMSDNCVFSPSGQFWDIFRTSFRHISDIWSTFPFSVGKIKWGVFGRGFSNNRFVLKPDVAMASEVSILGKNSLAITDFHAKKTQHVQVFENPLPGTPPHSRFPCSGLSNDLPVTTPVCPSSLLWRSGSPVRFEDKPGPNGGRKSPCVSRGDKRAVS